MLRKQRSRLIVSAWLLSGRPARARRPASSALGESLNRSQVVHEYCLREKILEVKRAEPALVRNGNRRRDS